MVRVCGAGGPHPLWMVRMQCSAGVFVCGRFCGCKCWSRLSANATQPFNPKARGVHSSMHAALAACSEGERQEVIAGSLFGCSFANAVRAGGYRGRHHKLKAQVAGQVFAHQGCWAWGYCPLHLAEVQAALWIQGWVV